MRTRIRIGFVGGLLGSLAVTGALALLVLLGALSKAGFVIAYQSVLGGGWITAAVLGGLLFVLIGALWAVPFAALVPYPTMLKGVIFGLLPTLWAWTFVPEVMTDGPLFGGFTLGGLLLPVVMNCLIWGSIVGWYCHRRISPAPPVAGHGHA